MLLALRSLLWTVLLPGMVAGYIPWRFFGLREVHVQFTSPVHSLGVLLILAGVLLLAACIWEFASSGRGTLAPVDPPRELVVGGLYRYVRNPMYLSVSTILLGEFLITGSWALLVYWAVFFILANLFVIGYEERTLRRRFGASYEQYTRRVGRWIPRFSLIVIAMLLLVAGKGAAQSLAITDVTIIDVRSGKTMPGQTVVIRGRAITNIGNARKARLPGDARLLDGRGKYLIPGFWDMHVHLNESNFGPLLSLGITGARDMAGDLEQLLGWRRGLADGTLTGPRLVFAGPQLRGPRSDTDSGAPPWVIRTAEQGTLAVDSLAARGANFIKVHEGLSRDAYFAIARAARARRLAFVGHVPASLTPIEVSDSGQKTIEHVEFVPDSCLPIFAGQAPAGCARSDLDALIAHLAANGTWFDPTIGSFRVFAREQWPAIFEGFKGLVPLLRAHEAKFLTGTDLGSADIVAGESLHDELALLVDAGFTPLEVLRAATYNAAAFLGLTDSLGIIEKGMLADLVLLDRNPLVDIHNTRSIAAVIRDGRLH